MTAPVLLPPQVAVLRQLTAQLDQIADQLDRMADQIANLRAHHDATLTTEDNR